MLGYLRAELPSKLGVNVRAHQIKAVETTSSKAVTNKITLTMADGSTVGLGALLHKADGPAVRGLICAAMSAPAPEPNGGANRSRPRRPVRAPKTSPT